MAAKGQKPESSKDIVAAAREHDELPPEMAEVLREIPEPQREEVTRIMTAGFGMISRISPEAEIAKKIKPEHISAMLDSQQKGMDYTYRENQHRMIFFVVVLLIIVVGVVIIIALLRENNTEAMTQILTALISAALGALGGYGLGTRKRSDD